MGRKSLLTYQSSILVQSGINQRVMPRAPLEALSRRPARQPRRSAHRPASSRVLHTFILSPLLLSVFAHPSFVAPRVRPIHPRQGRRPPSLPHPAAARRKFEVDTKLLRGRTRTARTIRRRGPPTSRIMLFTAAESSSVDGRGRGLLFGVPMYDIQARFGLLNPTRNFTSRYHRIWYIVIR